MVSTVPAASSPVVWVAAAVVMVAALLILLASFLVAGAGASASESGGGMLCHGEVSVPVEGEAWLSEAARSSGLPAWWLARIIDRESSWDPTNFTDDSNGGTWGLFQINRSEWAQLQPSTAGQTTGTPVGITDPLVHAEAAGRLLRQHYDTFQTLKAQQPEAAWASLDPLAAVVIMHNAGTGALMRYPNIPAITQDYVAEVMASDGVSSSGDCGVLYEGDGGPVVELAMSFQGVPYVWGGNTPAGFDCSGLMQYVYSQFGVSLPRVANDQAYFGQSVYAGTGFGVDMSRLVPGDLIAFSDSGGHNYQHIGMYIGGGQMVHAPQRGSNVSTTSLDWWKTQTWRVQRVVAGS